jgi:PleD family two-component response regulator
VLIDGIVTDITERRATDDELLRTFAELNETAAKLEQARVEAERLARTDALTGCFNRRHAREVLVAELRRARGAGTRVGVLVVDIDRFKAINDTRGHQVCDDLVMSDARVSARRAARRPT